jgi:hypothetical protein
MARSVSRDGTEPVKTRKVKSDSGVDLDLPYCNICEEPMNEIRLGQLLLWRPGFKWVRRFPLRYGAFLCEPCREKEGFGPQAFIAVPCPVQENGQTGDMIEALKDYIALLEEARNKGEGKTS